MKWYDRILLTVLSVFGAVFGLCMVSVAIGWPLDEVALRGISALCQEGIVRWILAVLALLLLLICARLLWVAFKRAGEFGKESVVVESSQGGQTFISREAIVAMVQRHAKENNHVSSCKAKVCSVEDKLELQVRLTVTQGTQIAELTKRLQESIKNCVHSSSGIKIDEVHILVESESAAATSRLG